MDDRLQAELEKVKAAGQRQIDVIREWRVSELPKLPKVVYHYTSDEGLHGILKSGQIWLTDVFAMNDPSELQHGLWAAVRVALERAQGGSRHAQMMADLFSTFPERGMEGAASSHIACFSMARDDLSQWRAYAQNGHGYAIGFHVGALSSAFLQPVGKDKQAGEKHGARGNFPVAYDEPMLERLQTEFVNQVFDSVDVPQKLGIEFPDARPFYVMLGALLSTHSLDIALNFKHEAYQAEKEYRLLAIQGWPPAPENHQWRRRPHELVQYSTFDWRAKHLDAVAEILIGPAADRVQAERFVTNCLRACDSVDVQVRHSAIPYRAPR